MDGEMAGGAAEARTVALFVEQMPPCHGVLGCKSLLLPLLEGHPKEETWCPAQGKIAYKVP